MTEQRSLMEAPEVRASGDGRSVTVAGYAAVFDSPADIGGDWREIIAPGAFSETLRRDDVLALAAHDSARILGRTSAGTLRLREDRRGLAVEIDLPDTSDGRDVAELVRRGDLKGMSFGFIVRHDEWDETANPPTRTIRSVDLMEVSAVGRPAYGDTSLGLRSLERAREQGNRDQAAQNRQQAQMRILARKAETENKLRGIRPGDSRD